MKTLKVLYPLCLLILFFGCKKIDDLQKDSGAIYEAKPQLVLTGLLLNSSDAPWITEQRHNQYMVLNMDYYGDQAYTWTTGEFTEFEQLKNVVRMEIEAEKLADLGAPYAALAKFFRAYFFTRLTERFGDIPMSEALQIAVNGNASPKYDEQKFVYQQILQLLDEANSDLASLVAQGVSVEGDFYYNGNLLKWQKLANSLKLRILISLSKRADDTPDLRIKEQFATIVNNPTQYPVILSNVDNFQLVYNGNSRSNNAPMWPADGVVVKTDINNTLAATYVDIAKDTRDPRLMIVAGPTREAKESGDPDYADKFSSYAGGSTGELQSELLNLSIAGKLSMINFDYWLASPSGIPTIQLGASEVHFTIAEAISRGWVGGDAARHYEAGVRASMEFFGVLKTKIDEFLINNSFKGNGAVGIEQILTQKYMSFFQNSGTQAYYQFRRTGVPEFHLGPANGNNNTIPVRWAYPTEEYTVNEAHVKEAITRQFGGADTRNGVMWMIK